MTNNSRCLGEGVLHHLCGVCRDRVPCRHLHENIRAEHLALLTGLSSKTVGERFRQETGYSIPDYLHAQRVEEAKYLLRYTEYSLAEISGILNYASQSYFTKIFRDRTGQTPQQYRDCPQELTNT